MKPNRLRGVAAALAVLSLVAALGAGLAAAIVTGGDDDSSSEPTTSGSGNPGWSTVSGIPGSAGPATYQVPGGADWELHDADFAVSYEDEDGTAYASGHAASFYYGNDCTDGAEKVAAGWALLGDTERGSDLNASAARSARRWARGYGTGAGGTSAPTDQLVVADLVLADGTPAVSARISLDMSVFEGPCLSGAAEVTVVSFPTRDGIKSLVAARYLGVDGGITDEVYDEILASVRPG
jgi:hypothetical protein